MDNQLLKPTDVAKKLNIGRSLAYELLRRGELPAVRIGKCVRVRREDLDTYITTHLSNQQ